MLFMKLVYQKLFKTKKVYLVPLTCSSCKSSIQNYPTQPSSTDHLPKLAFRIGEGHCFLPLLFTVQRVLVVYDTARHGTMTPEKCMVSRMQSHGKVGLFFLFFTGKCYDIIGLGIQLFHTA